MSLFTQARELYESITPIRDHAEDIRPLRRREHARRIVKLHDDAYGYCLYNANIVTVYSNGQVQIHMGGWNSPTTRDFINTYTPFYCRANAGITWIHNWPLPIDLPMPEEGLWLQESLNGDLMLMGKLYLQKKVINRDRSKVARQQIKGFLDWAIPLLTINENVGNEYIYVRHNHEIMSYILIGNEEGYYRGLCGLKSRYTNIIAANIKTKVQRLCYEYNEVYDTVLVDVTPNMSKTGFCGVQYDRG